LFRRVAAHREKGNLNLPYDSLSQCLFREVLQKMHTQPSARKNDNLLFFRMISARLAAEGDNPQNSLRRNARRDVGRAMSLQGRIQGAHRGGKT
jgi:hypothetical protein